MVECYLYRFSQPAGNRHEERGRSPMRTVLRLALPAGGLHRPVPVRHRGLRHDAADDALSGQRLGASSVPVAGLYYLVNLLAPFDRLLVGQPVGPADGPTGAVPDLRAGRRRRAGWRWRSLPRSGCPSSSARSALSISGGSMGQLFAAARDQLTSTATPNADRLIATLRMAFTAGWILGPVLGSWFGAQFGLRPLLIGAAALTAGQIVPLGRLRVRRVQRLARAGRGVGGDPAAHRRAHPATVVRLRRLLCPGDGGRHHQVRLPAALHGQPAARQRHRPGCGDRHPAAARVRSDAAVRDPGRAHLGHPGAEPRRRVRGAGEHRVRHQSRGRSDCSPASC